MGKAICLAPGCPQRLKGRGLCNLHYQRQLRLGSFDLPRRLTFAQRFWIKVSKAGPVPEGHPELGPCWIWTASKDRRGYGKFFVGKVAGKTKLVQAHRAAYEIEIGPVPAHLDLDHLCRVVACVNPLHLEPVTRQVNLLRGETLPAAEVLVTHCPAGHRYDRDNTYWYGNNRKCRKCRAEAGRRSRAKNRAKGRREVA